MIARRSFLAGIALTACTRREPPASDPPKAAPVSPLARASSASSVPRPPAVDTSVEAADAGDALRGQVAMQTWSFDGGGRAVVLVPSWARAGERLPVLVALHGRGEANKGPAEGVMGWPRDYALLRAIARLCAPPLTSDDLEGFVDPKRLADHNRSLSEQPFRGMVVVCPYSPDVDLRKAAQIRDYGDYVMRSVLPRVKREMPVLDAPPSFGIDGVSLGGALALRIGLANAEAFGAVGCLQPAIGEDQVAEYTDLVKTARAKNPKLALRLLTSKDDYFRSAVHATSSAWQAAGVSHELVEIPGPHDYAFNRGPGAIEMLLWHDHVLARG